MLRRLTSVSHVFMMMLVLAGGTSWAQGIDTNFYYRLTNAAFGDGRSLDTFGHPPFLPNLAGTGTYTGQSWRFTPMGGGTYRLTNLFQAQNRALDCLADNSLFMGMTDKPYSGQFWRLEPQADGTYIIKNNWRGPSFALAAYPMTNGAVFLGLATADPFSANQRWKLTRQEPISQQPPNAWAAVMVAGIEIIQSVQSMEHDARLIANRKTLARVYLDSQNMNRQLTGVITVTQTGGNSFPINAFNSVFADQASNGQLDFKRDELNRSLNFELPANALSAGNYTIAVTQVLDAATRAPVQCTNCTMVNRTVSFFPPTRLRLKVIGLSYVMNNMTYRPSAVDFERISSWLQRAYPISQLEYTALTVPSTNNWPFSCTQANAQIAAIRTLDIQGGTDRRTHYYGLVPDANGVNFMRGCADAVPSVADPSSVSSGPTGATLIAWDKDGSYGDFYAGHELGHTLGRNHVGGQCGEAAVDTHYPFQGGLFSFPENKYKGFDSEGALILKGGSWHDVMSYCPNEWLSAYTYNAIHQRLQEEDALAVASPIPVLRSGQSVDYLNVIATVNITQSTGKISSLQRTNDPSSGTSANGPSGVQATLRLSDSSGKTIAQHAVTVRESTDTLANADRSGLVRTAIPFPANVRRIELLLSEQVLDSRQVSASAPRFDSLNTPSPAQKKMAVSGKSSLLVQWKARDPDGDPLTYSVQLSSDNGLTWETVAIGLTQSSHEIPAEQVKDRKSVKIRVIASDGVNSGVIASEVK